MRVLFLAPKQCWPTTTGAMLRNYHLARRISDFASVTLLAFGDHGIPSVDFPSFYDNAVTIPRDPSYTLSKIVRGAVGRTPLPILNYTTQAMKQALTRLLSEGTFDIVQIESIHLSAYLPFIRKAPHRPLVICDWHNIESELMRRYSQQEARTLRKFYARDTSRKMGVVERRAMKEFDAHVVVSRRDESRLLQVNPHARVFVIENGVDTSYYADEQIEKAYEAWLADGKSRFSGKFETVVRWRRIVFVGSMDYHANIDAVVNFARDVWPSVREQEPEIIFTIVGRDPATEVRELASLPGVEVTGTVDDVRPYYHEAVAAVVPLRVGSGSRLKILEAMAAGIPVISTSLGAEGLDVSHRENILIGDGTRELKEAIRSVVTNDDVQRKLRVGGRALVSQHYEWARLGERLARVHDGLLKSNSSRQLSGGNNNQHRKQITPATIKLLALVEATTVNAVAKNLFDFHRSSLELRRKSSDFPCVELSLVTFERARHTAGAHPKDSENEFVSAARQLGLEVDVISERRRFDSSVIPALRQIVKQREPDIVLTHSVKSHFLLWRSKLWSNFPWVAFHHGYTTTDGKMRLYNQLDRWSLPKADKVITVCEAFARDLCDTKGISRDRIFVQHNSIRPEPKVSEEDVTALRARLGLAEHEQVVLAVGRLSREKAHIDLIEAFKQLSETNPELSAKLIIVGEGPERKNLESAAHSLGISGRVIFAGHISSVQPYYAIANVLANASHSEGSPYVLLEAMAAGLPIVATTVGGVPEMLSDKESALLVSPSDHRPMASAMARMLTDKQFAEELATHASALVSRYSPDTYARSLANAFRGLMIVNMQDL